MTMILRALLLSVALAFTVAADGTYTCIETKASQDLTTSGSATWTRLNCSDTAEPPLLAVNVLVVDLLAKDIKISPGVSKDAAAPLKPVPDLAASNPDRNFIAGINGGYFWRTDITGFWFDDVCRGKTRKEAETPASAENPNFGISDGLVMIDNKILGSNCDCWGFSRPALAYNLDASGEQGWKIDVLQRGEQGSPDIVNGIAAGPNLVSYTVAEDGSYSPFIDIPSDDDNINIHEHAANTGMGIIFDQESGKAVKMILLTTDGSDECGRVDKTCGIDAKHMAQLLIDQFGVHQAMSMDQGGSTTMWVKGQENGGVVSNAGYGARNVANALFIEALSV